MSERYLTIPATADTLSLSRATIYRLIDRGQLRSVRVAGRLRVPERAIDELVAEGTDDARPKHQNGHA